MNNDKVNNAPWKSESCESEDKLNESTQSAYSRWQFIQAANGSINKHLLTSEVKRQLCNSVDEKQIKICDANTWYFCWGGR
jgi:hypothetical protein